MYTRRAIWSAMVTLLGTVGMGATSAAQMQTPAQRIDQKARTVRADDENSVRALVDEIFNSPAQFPPLPISMETVLKDRLIRAEIAYLKGTKSGVQERDITQLVNFLADSLGAPPYAKTSEHQVRFLRTALALRSPIFMTRGRIPEGMKAGQTLNPTMSPLQAAYLLKAVMDQKVWDPDYQLEPAEWEKNEQTKKMESQRKIREKLQSGELKPGQPLVELVVQANPKRREVQEILSQKISSLSLVDGLDLLNQASLILGIEK